MSTPAASPASRHPAHVRRCAAAGARAAKRVAATIPNGTTRAAAGPVRTWNPRKAAAAATTQAGVGPPSASGRTTPIPTTTIPSINDSVTPSGWHDPVVQLCLCVEEVRNGRGSGLGGCRLQSGEGGEFAGEIGAFLVENRFDFGHPAQGG